jgi:fatty-acyl-CoA synthase
MQRLLTEVTTIGDLVDRQAAVSDAEAVVFPESRTTYRELERLTTDFARALHGAGVGHGDKVGILMPNNLDYVLALVGTAKLGAVGVPVNGRFKAHELGHVLSHADVKVLLCATGPPGTPDYPAMLGDVFDDLEGQDPRALTLRAAPLMRQIVDLGSGPLAAGMVSRAQFEAGAAEVAESVVHDLQARVRVRDIALLMYTSGTTAKPKGCLLTHEAITRQGRAVALTRFALTAEDRFWDPLPLFHCGGIVPMMGCFWAGARYCHAGHFDPDVALGMLEQERITVAYPAFETIWFGVLNHPRFAQADLSSIRLIQNITVPERLAQFEARMPWARQVTSYGSTEGATNLTMPTPEDSYEVRMNTLGSAVPGMEIKIADPETGETLGAGEVGELCFRGYSRFEGYYKDPEQTARSIDDEDYFHTGDLASLRPDGNLVFGGRLKDMLKVGGENVSALEVESYLAAHPDIEIVQVVGADDARYDEVPAVFVQTRAGAHVTEQEVIDFCRGRIASYKVPRYVRFVTEWPMSGTKIQKFRLREQLAEELQALGITEAPKVDSAPARVAAG